MTRPLTSRPLLRPVLTLFTGSAGAFALAYLARPALTRLYTQEAFGLQGLFIAVVLVLNAVSSLRYEDALQLPRRPRDAANLAALAVALVGLGAVLTLAAWPFRATIDGWFDASGFAPWVVWLPVGVALVGWKMIGDAYLVRQRRFAVVSQAAVAGGLTGVAGHLIGGWLDAGAAGLIYGSLAGFAAAAVVAWHTLTRRNTRLWRAVVRWRAMRTQARRYRRFPRYTTPASFLGVATQRLLFLGTPLFFSLSITGLVTQAFVVLSTPLALLGQAVNQAFVVEAVRVRGDRAALGTLTAGVHARLVALGLYPAGVVTVAGPPLFGLIFGADWTEAGAFLQVLAPWIWLMHVASPLTRLFDVLETQRAELGFGIALFVLHGAGLLVGGLAGDVWLMITLFAAAGVVGRVAQLAWLLHAGGVPLRTALRPYVRYLLRAALPLAATALAASLAGPVVVLVVAGAGALAYYGWLAHDEGLAAYFRPPTEPDQNE